MIKPAAQYIGQVIDYNGTRYTITEGPADEQTPLVFVTNQRGQESPMATSLDDNGNIVRAATRRGPWRDVTVTTA